MSARWPRWQGKAKTTYVTAWRSQFSEAVSSWPPNRLPGAAADCVDPGGLLSEMGGERSGGREPHRAPSQACHRPRNDNIKCRGSRIG